MRSILIALILLFGSPAHAAWDKGDFSLSAVPYGGYHLGLSDFGGTATSSTGGRGLSQGPLVGTRLKAALDRFFMAPDLSIGPLLGVGGTPFVWSIGFIAGPHLSYSGFDVYAGLSHKDFVSYDGSGGTFYRLGAAFNLEGKAFQIFAEAIYGSLTRYTETYQAKSTYFGFEGGVQFPIELGAVGRR